MSSPRLPFLYPNLARAVRACKPKTHSSVRSISRPQDRKLHISARRNQTENYSQRYGPAAEAQLPPPSKPNNAALPSSNKRAESPDTVPPTPEQSKGSKKAAKPEQNASEELEKPLAENPTVAPSEEQGKSSPEQSPPTPLDIVLRSPAEDHHRPPPHLATPPYVHHFDTYSLVRDLAKGGFTEDQAVTIMKSVRLMLAGNLDLAKDGLVSKSDVENEMYLFRAACSELRTSLQTSRGMEIQSQRTQRTHLQHEADILSQKVNQDLAGLKEDLKGMFNERKLAVQEEKRSLDGKIQQLNYEITVMLNSDSKSEVEGLRWVLTRRAALAIGISAFMALCTLNYSSIQHQKEEELKKKQEAAQKAAASIPPRSQGTQTEKGEGRAYEESLG
ncbi:MAG: hypothetical protein Q9227_008228 [Pyrenula ochraceoflavens]